MSAGRSFHHLRYFLSDAWDEWRHSPGVNLLAVGTLASVLFLAGLVMLVLANVQGHVEDQRESIRVEIYLTDDVPSTVVSALNRKLEVMEGVSRVEYVDKAEALRRYRQWPANMADLIDELETNPLPASLEVFLVPGPNADGAAQKIARGVSGAEGVEDVRFDRELLERLEGLLDLASLGGTVLAILIFSAVVFVIAAVLRLAVYARRDEIEIMMLVGATPSFVRGPFLVAGLAQGMVASLVALLVVEGLRIGARLGAASSSAALLDLVALRPLSLDLSAMLVAMGLVVAFCGSYFAVRRTV